MHWKLSLYVRLPQCSRSSMQSVAVAMMTIAEAAFLFSLNANFHITFVFRFYLSSFICAFVSFLLHLFLFKFKCRQLLLDRKKKLHCLCLLKNFTWIDFTSVDVLPHHQRCCVIYQGLRTQICAIKCSKWWSTIA